MKISNGTVHTTPVDMRGIFSTHPVLQHTWQDLTPLARNEWICWIISAKKEETRERRIRIMKEKLLRGERRPCCWVGCPHR